MPLLLPRHSPNSNLFSSNNKNSRFCIFSLIFILHCNKQKFYYPFRPKFQKSTTTRLLVFSLASQSVETHATDSVQPPHVLWHLLPPGGSDVTSRLDTTIVPDCHISFQLQVIFFQHVDRSWRFLFEILRLWRWTPLQRKVTREHLSKTAKYPEEQ